MLAATAAPQQEPSTSGRHAYSNVLHELVYALLGVCGDVFISQRPETDELTVVPPTAAGFEVTRDAAWLSDADRKELSQILALGFHYGEIERFVNAHLQPLTEDPRRAPWQALAIGLEELCVVYQAAVLRVEQHVLTADTPTLASIPHFLSEFAALLPSVHTLLWELKQGAAASDVAIMDALFRRSLCGDARLQAVLQRLLWHYNQMLFKHLSAWLLHGLLLDTGFEFFITKSGGDVDSAVANGERGAVAWAAFSLHLGRVPTYVPDSAPPKILTIGRAMNLFRHHDRVAHRGRAPVDTGGRPSSRGGATDVATGAARSEVLITDEDLKGISQQLSRVASAPVFSGAAVAHAIDVIHDKVSKALNAFMTRTSQLAAHVAAIRDTLLLGRGDFFRDFLEASADMFLRPPRPDTAAADLLRPWRAAAASTGLEHDPCFRHVSITWSKEAPTLTLAGGRAAVVPVLAAARASELCWNGVRAHYTPPWPLPLLLRPDALDVYSALFSYFLTVERAARALDDTWAHLQTQRRVSRRRACEPAVAAEWALHQRMAHFVRHVQTYLKQDVAQRAFAAFDERVEDAQTFVQVQSAHEQLVSTLQHQTFLTTPAVCDKLQAVLQQCALLGSTAAQKGVASVAEIARRFDDNAAIFCSLLRSERLQGQTKGLEAIQQLLLRINFNRFYDRAPTGRT